MTKLILFCLLVVLLCAVGSCCLRSATQERRNEHQQQQLTELETIELEGTEAALKGVPVQACPYPSVQYNYSKAQHWKQGWIKGFTSKK